MASKLPWSWTTGDYTGGDPTTLKRFRRLWADVSGDTSIAVYVDNALKHTATGSTWLPSGCIGYRLKLVVSSASGSGAVTSLSLEGELLDGA